MDDERRVNDLARMLYSKGFSASLWDAENKARDILGLTRKGMEDLFSKNAPKPLFSPKPEDTLIPSSPLHAESTAEEHFSESVEEAKQEEPLQDIQEQPQEQAEPEPLNDFAEPSDPESLDTLTTLTSDSLEFESVEQQASPDETAFDDHSAAYSVETDFKQDRGALQEEVTSTTGSETIGPPQTLPEELPLQPSEEDGASLSETSPQDSALETDFMPEQSTVETAPGSPDKGDETSQLQPESLQSENLFDEVLNEESPLDQDPSSTPENPAQKTEEFHFDEQKNVFLDVDNDKMDEDIEKSDDEFV